MNIDFRNQIILSLQEKLKRIGISENELGPRFDLVRSGLLNSLEFVELVSSLEKMYNLEIDFEKALETGDFTTIEGLTRTFSGNLS